MADKNNDTDKTKIYVPKSEKKVYSGSSEGEAIKIYRSKKKTVEKNGGL